MSMNLHASAGGQDLGLRQTPTYITWMCMVDAKGVIPSELKGAKARHAIYRYLFWLDSSLSGNTHYSTTKDYDNARKLLNEEIQLIKDHIKHRNICVWWR